MNELDFREWLSKNTNQSKKVQGDNVSRVRKIEKELNVDLDKEFKKNQCAHIVECFAKKGENEQMKKHGKVDLPIGKYTLGAYRYALKQYINYLSK